MFYALAFALLLVPSGHASTLDYSFSVRDPAASASSGATPPTCTSTTGLYSLVQTCSGATVLGGQNASAALTPGQFSLKLDGQNGKFYDSSILDYWYVELSVNATYSSEFVVEGAQGSGWLDFDARGSGHNPFSGSISVLGVTVMGSGSNGASGGHVHVPVTFGVPIPYFISLSSSSYKSYEPYLSGTMSASGWRVTDADGVLISGATVSELATAQSAEIVSNPEPSTAMLGIGGLLVILAMRRGRVSASRSHHGASSANSFGPKKCPRT